ncbi:MAG TPA: class II fumarate hydratase [Pseudomonadales bacterium]
MTATRDEQDSLGIVAVPEDAYWGAHTQRSLMNFPIGEERMPMPLIHAYAAVKRAAAQANARLGVITSTQADAIADACDEIVAGHLDQAFPLSVWQTGSGTQTNMNVNEVLANRATEILGGDFRREKRIHPNDHVNASQSSNDTFPTAMHVAALSELRLRLEPALRGLRESLDGKARAWSGIVKSGRTHLMDATPLTLGQEFSGYVAQLDGALAAIADSAPRLSRLALGGTAVGTGLNAPAGFAALAIKELSRATGLEFQAAENYFAELSAHDTLLELSGHLNRLAAGLLHIGNQIRLLASGPRTGLAELVLPANEPGSSIMPGKVNPTQCEALCMVCVRVIGNHLAVTVAATHGHLQLNTFKPLIAYSVLQSLRLLTDACASFERRCIRDMEPNLAQIAALRERSLMLVTALAPVIGYDKAAEVAKKAFAENTSLREAALALGVLDADALDRLLDPATMLGSR